MSEPNLQDMWTNIIEMPTVINGVHESCYRSHAILQQVLRLASMGANPQVIIWFVIGANAISQKEERQPGQKQHE